MSWNNALENKKPAAKGYSHNYDAANNALLRERVVTLEKQMVELVDAVTDDVLKVELINGRLDAAEKRVATVMEMLDQQTEILALLMAEMESR